MRGENFSSQRRVDRAELSVAGWGRGGFKSPTGGCSQDRYISGPACHFFFFIKSFFSQRSPSVSPAFDSRRLVSPAAAAAHKRTTNRWEKRAEAGEIAGAKRTAGISLRTC